MSLPVYPSIDPTNPALRGITWPIKRSMEFSTLTQRVQSGKEVSMPQWVNPVYHWVLDYNYLLDDAQGVMGYNNPSVNGSNLDTDLRVIEGLYGASLGGANPFLFDDPSDDNVVGQLIGTGDGTNTEFQLCRTFAGVYTEPIYAPMTTPAPMIFVDGAAVTPASIGDTGLVTLSAPPAATKLVTANFFYYFTCKFEDDILEFSEFMFHLWELKEIKIRSLKI